MVSGYFGVPGCGKTTFLTMFAVKEFRRMKRGKSRYKHIYTNFPCTVAEKISFFDLGKFDIQDSLILLDELTLDSDARDYKSFSKASKDFFTLHRHANCDVIYFVQDFERVDKTIRNVTFDLWSVSKSILPGLRSFSVAKRIFRNVNINEFSSELTIGYRFCTFLESIFGRTKRFCFRRRYYKFFDSFDLLQLSDLPPYTSEPWFNS